MLRIGDPAPDFELLDDQGHSQRLSELLKDGPLILYFYPKDFTLICTQQACMFKAEQPELIGAGVRVIGISPQVHDRHQSFRAHYRLPFPLLADPERKVIRAYGAEGLLGVRRVSYLIGKDARILDRVRAELLVGRHRAFVRRVRERLRSGP
jgi:peroxiredoxin Q/BCP